MTNGECIYSKTVDCPGWLLKKTILEGFLCSGNFVLQEIGGARVASRLEMGL